MYGGGSGIWKMDGGGRGTGVGGRAPNTGGRRKDEKVAKVKPMEMRITNKQMKNFMLLREVKSREKK